MSALLVLPILFPLLCAAAGMVVWRSRPAQQLLGTFGAVGLLSSALCLLYAVDQHGLIHVQVGNWPAPFGITLMADRLSAIMVCLAGVMGMVVCIYARADVDYAKLRAGFYPLLMVLLMGVCGAFLTADIFNLYVWFEVMLMASFVLLGLGGGRNSMEGAVKYVALNLIGSMVFLTAVGVLYGTAGTLNMADLHLALKEAQQQNPMLVLALGAMFAVAFALKSALFPLFFWLPASYHVPSAGVCAIFAALLTKVGVYALVRVFTLVFPDPEPIMFGVLVLAAITMLSGVFGAVTQYEVKRILAWHSISQVGYIVVGVGLLCVDDPATRALGLAATIVFLVHHGLVKPALFLIAGLIARRAGTTQLKQIGGMGAAVPWVAALFLIAALSLAGLPPSSGFWAKLAVVRAAIVAEHYAVLTAALAAGILTLMSMIKIWNEAFWKPWPYKDSHHHAHNDSADHGHDHNGHDHDDDHGHGHGPSAKPAPAGPRIPLWMSLPTIALVGFITLIGFWPQPLLGLADRAAAQLLDPAAYVEALGMTPVPVDSALQADDAAPTLAEVQPR